MRFRLANISLSIPRLSCFGRSSPCLRSDKSYPQSTALTGSLHIKALRWRFNPAPRALWALSRRKRRGKPVSRTRLPRESQMPGAGLASCFGCVFHRASVPSWYGWIAGTDNTGAFANERPGEPRSWFHTLANPASPFRGRHLRRYFLAQV